MENLKKRKLNIIGNVLFCLIFLLVMIIGFLAIQVKLSGAVPSIFGNRFYVVLSGSMEPSIHMGSLIVVKSVDTNALKIKDVITFNHLDSGKIVTHRIVKITEISDVRYFTTRGDANDTNDFESVKYENVIGKVGFSIPLVGSVINFASTKKGILFLVIIPGLLLFVFQIQKLFKYAIMNDRKKEAAKRAIADIEEKEEDEMVERRR
ncbi:MAG: signal peptidase I [Saccharofermentanales bacterium]